jgi:hypothetical protein
MSFEFDGDLYVRVDEDTSWSIQHLCCLRSLPFAAGKDMILPKSLSSALCHIEYRTDYSDFDAFNLRLFTLRGMHAISIMSSAQHGLLTTFRPLTSDSFSPLAIGPTSLQNKLFRPGIQLYSPIFTAVGSGNCVLVVVDAKDAGVIKLVRYNTQTNSISVRDLPFPSSTRYSIKSVALDDHLGILYILMGRNIVSLAFS